MFNYGTIGLNVSIGSCLLLEYFCTLATWYPSNQLYAYINYAAYSAAKFLVQFLHTCWWYDTKY